MPVSSPLLRRLGAPVAQKPNHTPTPAHAAGGKLALPVGHVGSVSLPLTMARGSEGEPHEPGTRIAMVGIGSGLSSVMLGVRW